MWRAKNNSKPRRIETLDDGSWLAELRRNNTKLDTEHVVIRVVDYDVDDGRNVESGPFRLFTTLLDPNEVSATELAAAYAQRWEIESAFDELKTHQRGARTAHEAAVDPDRVSFVAALRISRRSLSPARGFPPSGLE